jgi:predicted DNA-binding transcriptional regulator AlpA
MDDRVKQRRGMGRRADLREQAECRFADVPALLTAKDLEQLLRIDVKTIYGYVQRGLIPYVKIQSNVRFVKDDIVDWIEARRSSTSPKPAT